MWKLVPFLALISSCLSAPKPDEIGTLIENVFPPPTAISTTERSGDLGSLIDETFGNPNGNFNNGDQDEKSCICVPYYNCNANGTIESDGKGLIDIRLKNECEGVLDTCCTPPDILEKPVTPNPIKRTGCGQRRSEGVGVRIIGAENNEALFGEFPWMVAVLSGQNSNSGEVKTYECGGSLIHPSVVLTAAHCVINKADKNFLIRAGEWDTQSVNQMFPHQDRTVERIITHPNYKEGSLHNDFALLILSQPVQITDNVDITCLPDTHDVFDHNRCFATGWGKNHYGKQGVFMVILKKIDLPVVPHDQCQRALRNTRLGTYFKLDRSFICAGGEKGKDTCKGDGGSPLVCPLRNDPSRYVQAGIVSWGIGCGDEIPGVYSNVPLARPWIDEVLAYNNLDNTVYQYTPEYVF